VECYRSTVCGLVQPGVDLAQALRDCVAFISGYVCVRDDKMSNVNETSTEPILYELLEYFVRKQEPELIVSPRYQIKDMCSEENRMIKES